LDRNRPWPAATRPSFRTTRLCTACVALPTCGLALTESERVLPGILDQLEAEDRVVLRYTSDCNGSMRGIAGILNQGRNVMGMMPHPERAADALVGGTDGLVILRSLVSHARHGRLGAFETEHEVAELTTSIS